MNYKSFSALFATLLAVISVWGCGGGGSNGGGGGPVSPELAAVKRVTAQFQSLTSKKDPGANTKLAAYIKSQPEFETSGVSNDGCVYGVFKNGRIYIAVNNQSSVVPPAAVSNVRTHGSAEPSLSIPTGDAAILYNALEPLSPSCVLAVEEPLSKAGYATVSGSGSVADWKNLKGPGLFIFECHGGTANLSTTEPIFGFETSEVASDALNNTYADDLDKRNLIYMGVRVFDSATKNHAELRYAVTASFIKKYATFGANSFVYAAACSSDDAGMKAAFLDKGASVYAGWTTPIKGWDATAAGRFMVDRFLGLNKEVPVHTDPTLPINWMEVRAGLETEQGPFGHVYSESTDDETHIKSILKFTQKGGALGGIIPTIKSVSADVLEGTLTFEGESFGSTKAAAKLGTANLTIKSWTDSTIVTNLPDLTGMAVVQIGLRKSNPMAINVPTLTPKTSEISQYEAQNLNVRLDGHTPKDGFSYHWTCEGNYGTIFDFHGHSGKSFDSSDDGVSYGPNLKGSGTDAITVEVSIRKNGKTTKLGTATASVKVKMIDASVTLFPKESGLTVGGSEPLVATVKGNDTSRPVTYHWVITGSNGTISDGTRTGKTLDTDKASVTYTVLGSAKLDTTDTISVKAFTVPKNGPNIPLGTDTCTVETRDIGPGGILVAITDATFDLHNLSNGPGPRIIPQLFMNFVPGSSTYMITGVFATSGLNEDGWDITQLDFKTPTIKVGQTVDMAGQRFRLIFSGAGVFSPVSGKLKILKIEGNNIEFEATMSLAGGDQSMDIRMTGWFSGIH